MFAVNGVQMFDNFGIVNACRTYGPLATGAQQITHYIHGNTAGGWDKNFYTITETGPANNKHTATNYFVVARMKLWAKVSSVGGVLDALHRLMWNSANTVNMHVVPQNSALSTPLGMQISAGNHAKGFAYLELVVDSGHFRVTGPGINITNGQIRAWSAPSDGFTELAVQCFSPGSAKLVICYTNANAQGVAYKSSIKFKGHKNLTILADDDRNGIINDADDHPEKATWTEGRGAIYNTVFYRYDNTTFDANNIPIPTVIHFGDDGEPSHETYTIKTSEHADDITPFVIKKINHLPAGHTIHLRVGDPKQIRRVHVYKNIQPGETAIWGSWTAPAGHSFVKTDIDITAYVSTVSNVTFGVEGLGFRNTFAGNQEFDGTIDFTLEMRDNAGVVIDTDSIQFKIAPLIFLSSDQASEQIWAAEWGVWNQSFLYNANADSGYKGLDDVGAQQFRTVPWSSATNHTAWLQDTVKIGYTERPGKPPKHVVLRMPYERNDGAPQPTWPLEYMLTNNVGVFQLGKNLGATPRSADYGGNLEVLSPNADYPLGRIVLGDSKGPSQQLKTFLKSQEVQNLIEDVDVSYLWVSHIDEITLPLPNNEIIVASPALGIKLLENIDEADRAASVFFSTGKKPITGVVQPGSQINEIKTGIDYTGTGNWKYIRIYESTLGFPGIVAEIERFTTDSIIITTNMWWTPMSLDYYTSIAHELPAPVPAIMKPWIAQADDKFILCEGTKFWTGKSQLNNPAIVTVKELFEDANFINFNKIIIQTKIDTAIGVLTNKHSGLIVKPVPSLFLGKIDNGTNVVAHSASAFNPGAANMQPVANKLYIPRQFAPLDNNTKDIFEDKIKTVLGNNIEFIDSWFYHVGVGNIHCGSTVKRSPPLNWWTKQPTTQP